MDLWSTWYRAYLETPLPRLIIRYEDLLFDSKRTLKAVCDCAGGRLKTDFDFIADPAKFGNAHGGVGTSRQAALKKYASELRRYESLSSDDLAYLDQGTDADLLTRFGYTASEDRRRALLPADADATHDRRCMARRQRARV